jgi:hypothetical protein
MTSWICARGQVLGQFFSLAIPYARLAHVFDLDWAESQGSPTHIVRLSVGLESEDDLEKYVSRASEGFAAPWPSLSHSFQCWGKKSNTVPGFFRMEGGNRF